MYYGQLTRELTEESAKQHVEYELAAAPSGKLTTARFMRHWQEQRDSAPRAVCQLCGPRFFLSLNVANGRHHGY